MGVRLEEGLAAGVHGMYRMITFVLINTNEHEIRVSSTFFKNHRRPVRCPSEISQTEMSRRV